MSRKFKTKLCEALIVFGSNITDCFCMFELRIFFQNKQQLNYHTKHLHWFFLYDLTCSLNSQLQNILTSFFKLKFWYMFNRKKEYRHRKLNWNIKFKKIKIFFIGNSTNKLCHKLNFLQHEHRYIEDSTKLWLFRFRLHTKKFWAQTRFFYISV